MLTISRTALLGSFKRRFDTVQTLAGEVRIRNLTEGEKSDFEQGQLTAKGELNLSAVRAQRRKLIAATVVDEVGDLLLNQPGDVERLKDLDAAVTSALFDAATRHCGFTREEVDELKKNYEEASAADSPTV